MIKAAQVFDGSVVICEYILMSERSEQQAGQFSTCTSLLESCVVLICAGCSLAFCVYV